MGICSRKYVKDYLKKYPYGIHYNETNDITMFKINELTDFGTMMDLNSAATDIED